MTIHRDLLIRAAEIIKAHASSLRECHTVDGSWGEEEEDVRHECEEMDAVAEELRRNAG